MAQLIFVFLLGVCTFDLSTGLIAKAIVTKDFLMFAETLFLCLAVVLLVVEACYYEDL